MNNRENSPFTPGSPVPVELFVGRRELIKEVLQYIKQTSYGKQENVFLAGDRGIGKSSLVSFLRSLVVSQENILGIHVFLGRISTLEEMVRHIFDELLKETKGQTWFKNIAQFFGKHIRKVDLFGISVSFSPPEQDLKELVRRFPEALYNLLEKIKEEKRGLFIALDDINGLADKVEFAHWYKSFVDEVATHYRNFPVFVMLTGLPEKRDILCTLQPSLMRIFRVVEIEKLSDEEVKNFLSKAFEKTDMEVKSEAMDSMVKFTSGLPI
ncbi:MAG: ATP-binding protein, partial [candidate division KSB1 bacterium]|nr:ATP-binding protein [candidate division KSB1 bacterium]